jgi:plasmid replication initiation protein
MYAEAPKPYKEAFAQRKRIVESRFREKVQRVVQRLRKQYKIAESQQREEIRQAFLDQLENNAQYAVSKPVQESVI